ncbi:MAG: hypothetical protein IPH81_11065 [Candidatus Microthrix sp.]|nr:hypothetical protein [Candidatus Microthrix sp.]
MIVVNRIGCSVERSIQIGWFNVERDAEVVGDLLQSEELFGGRDRVGGKRGGDRCRKLLDICESVTTLHDWKSTTSLLRRTESGSVLAGRVRMCREVRDIVS